MAAFDDAWAAFESQAGPILADALSGAAPVVTGELAASMDWRDQTGVLTAGSNDARGPIAAYVTRGTRPHPIEPVNARFLHFIASDGTEVYTTHVDHPGTSPNPFHVTAWQASAPTVVDLFRRKMGSGLTLAYLNPWRNRQI